VVRELDAARALAGRRGELEAAFDDVGESLGPSATTGGAPVAAYRRFGVTRAVNTGVVDELATLAVCLVVEDGVSGSAAAPAAATTTALTAQVTRVLRVWVVVRTMYSLRMVAAPGGPRM